MSALRDGGGGVVSGKVQTCTPTWLKDAVVCCVEASAQAAAASAWVHASQHEAACGVGGCNTAGVSSAWVEASHPEEAGGGGDASRTAF